MKLKGTYLIGSLKSVYDVILHSLTFDFPA